MATISPFYSTAPETPEVYHDDSECPYGKQIKTENKKYGTDGRKKCAYCKS